MPPRQSGKIRASLTARDTLRLIRVRRAQIAEELDRLELQKRRAELGTEKMPNWATPRNYALIRHFWAFEEELARGASDEEAWQRSLDWQNKK